jgi:Uma2 family endonuclease
MGAERTRTRWTYAEFARLPSEGGTRYEVIDDELYVTPAPGTRHQRIVTDLVVHLGAFVRSHGLGELFVSPFDVLFAEGDYMEPDLVFVRRDRVGLLSDRGVEGAPDLVVEVLSPSTAGRDRGIKLDRYRLFGVPEYWIIDAESRTVDIWKLAEGADEPVTLSATEGLRWQPMPGGPVLDLPLEELLGRA